LRYLIGDISYVLPPPRLAGQLLRPGKRPGCFDKRKLKEVLPDIFFHPFPQKHRLPILQNQVVEESFFFYQFFGLYRQLTYALFAKSIAILLKQAGATKRISRGTMRGTKIHNSLVVASGITGVEQATGECRKILFTLAAVNGQVDPEKTGQYAKNISVNYCVRQVECEGSDGRCRVGPNALQGKQLFVGFRKSTAAFTADVLRGVVHIARAGIISQSLP